MSNKKDKFVYETGDDRTLSREERNEKRINFHERRLDGIASDLYLENSEHALRKIPELEKRLDNMAMRIAFNDSEIRIYRDAIFSLQREVYPLTEACEVCKMNRKIRLMWRTPPKAKTQD